MIYTYLYSLYLVLMKGEESSSTRLWQRTVLLVAGTIEIVIGGTCLILIIVFGCHGFAAGETGTMIGIFALALSVFLIPLVVIRTVAVYGLLKKRRWAGVLTIILSAIILLGSLFIARISPAVFIMLLLYTSFCAWLAVLYLRHADELN